MNVNQENRFQDFFRDRGYASLKNHLYNYLLRKRAVGRALRGEREGLVLEVGSGMSPVVTNRAAVVATDLSWLALRNLRDDRGDGWYVAADALHLPFRDGSFLHVVSSEVLEHIPDDGGAIGEMARLIAPAGRLIITFPHRRCYFACDDRFVHHLRRYELGEVVAKLRERGLHPQLIRKVLGPLEKMTMCLAVVCYALWAKVGGGGASGPPRPLVLCFKAMNVLYAGIAWLDAAVMPRCLSSVLLVKAAKGAVPDPLARAGGVSSLRR